MGKALLLAAICALSAGAAMAQDREPDWLKRPTSDDLMAVWPRAALQEGLGGKATIVCVVSIQGTLKDCKVESESPEGKGFGAAAIVLSGQFRMKPAMRAGQVVEVPIRIPITFPRPAPETGSYLAPKRISSDLGNRVYSRVSWVEAPSYADVVAAYPEKARTAGLGGSVSLDCRFGKNGAITGCDVINEGPEGLGFGKAAQALGKKFKGPATDGQGNPMERSRATLTVAFAPAMLQPVIQVIGNPRWTALPTVENFAAVLPRQALEAGVLQARVVLACIVGADGGLTVCKSDSETPPGHGYADAALALSGAFRLGVWSDEGLPTVGGRIRVPVRFDFRTTSPATKP